MKTFKHFSEDIESRRQELKQRQNDQMQAAKDAVAKKRERDRDKEEIKKEIKRELEVDEAYDASVMGSSQIRKTGQRGEIGRDRRKSEPERRRMKAVGGGKMEPAKKYKDRKDIGYQRGSQTPELKAGTAGTHAAAQAAAAKAERKKAALARIAARKAGKEAPKSTTLSKKEKTAISRKITQKPKKEVSPNYKPAKASGYSRDERRKLKRAGDRLIRDIRTGKEKKASHYDPKL